MIKQKVIILCALILGIKHIIAQSPQNFEQLKPVANPAYMLLGVSPTNIERPTTPKEFVAGLQSATVNGKLAPNFAMEITPYELLSKNRKKDYTFKAYDYLLNKDWGTNLARSIGLSFATSESDTIALGRLKKGTSAAFGLKMLLVNGKPKKETVKALTNLAGAFEAEAPLFTLISLLKGISTSNITVERADKNLNTALNTATASIQSSASLTEKEKAIKIAVTEGKFELLKDQIQEVAKNDTVNVATMIKLIEDERAEYLANQNTNLRLVNSKFAFAREGFMLEANVGVLSHFEYNSWDSLRYAKMAIWLTPSYKWNISKKDPSSTRSIDIIGLVRYTGNDIKVDSSSYIDLGAKLQFTFNKISFSGEYIYRQLTQKPKSIHYDYTDRLSLNLEYVINNLITLKVSTGRTFDGNSMVYDKPNDKIFAVGGINFSVLNGQ